VSHLHPILLYTGNAGAYPSGTPYPSIFLTYL
jgi:hypothetical protein